MIDARVKLALVCFLAIFILAVVGFIAAAPHECSGGPCVVGSSQP
jgi:hypothetical protein